MIRLTLLLCVGLFAAMLIIGQDRGQIRFGLLNIPETAPATAEVAPDSATPVVVEVTEAAFAPGQPLIAAPAVEPVAEQVVVDTTAPETGLIMQVNANSANVRSGPGKDFEVVGRLNRGEAVSVVVAGEGPDGWSRIRIEGDGVEGYVASRLLSE